MSAPEHTTADARAAVEGRERCLLCDGRHQSNLLATGRRLLTVREVAAHLRTSEEQVYKWIKSGALLKAPNRGPRQTAVIERNVVNFQEGRPQEAPPMRVVRPAAERRRSKAG